MDLTTLNLSQEQLGELTAHITGEVDKTKEAFEEFMSKDDATKLTQSETDKVRTEFSRKIKDYEDKLKELSPVVKSDAELATDARILALEGREKEVALKGKLLDVTNKLNEQGLPTQLAKYLQGAEDVETEITSLKELFDNTLLNNSYKPTNHKSTKDVVTKEQFQKMSYTERTNLFKSNEELYNKLSR